MGYYLDDGFTGTNFNRPGFKRLLADIESGKIDCVLVKDLSRFGRDYIDIGYYLERYFPQKGVRFIAIGDRIDSARGPYDIMLPLKNVFNAQYAKDTSDKVRKSFRTKQMRGEFVSAFPPYGYAKDPNDKNHFVIDTDAAKNVVFIFEQKASGITDRGIARMLNASGILSPIEYKRSKGVKLSVRQKYRGKCHWSDSAVHRILQNEMYLGHMVSNRYPSDTMHGKARLAPRSEWIIVEGMHEPIVSRKLWNAVHKNAAAAETVNARQDTKRADLFSGFLRCGDCGCALSRKGGNSKSYICSSYKAYGTIACSRHTIREDVLAEAILADLNQLIAQVQNIDKLAENQRSKRGARLQQDNDIRRPDAVISRMRRQKQRLYEGYRAGSISREEYIRRKEDYDKQEHSLTESLKPLNEPKEHAAPSKEAWVDKLVNLGKLETLDRMILKETVKEIRVFEDGRLEISYLFSHK